MKEEYMEPELKIVCFASMQPLALDLGGGEGNEASLGTDDDFGMDIL